MTTLVRYDQNIGRLLDLDQEAIKRAANKLIAFIKNLGTEPIFSANGERDVKLAILAYAERAKSGAITEPRVGDDAEYFYEQKEGLLPENILSALYGLDFYTKGLLRNESRIVEKDRVIYTEVDPPEDTFISKEEITAVIQRFDAALKAMELLDESHPGEPSFESIIMQLKFVLSCLNERRSPIESTDKEFNFGFLAMKEVRTYDESLSKELAELDVWVRYNKIDRYDAATAEKVINHST